MSWAAVVPIAASLIGGAKQKDAADYNAKALDYEGQMAMADAGVAEQQQRRSARQQIGRSAAALAQSGVGPGGSGADVMDQSMIDAELDALNVRNKGVYARYGFGNESRLMKMRGRTALFNGVLNAGASYLRGTSGGYTDGL